MLPDGPRPTVVALLDSGINPYHVAFAASPGRDAVSFASRLGNISALSLANAGEWKDRVEADKSTWGNITKGQLYAIEGTRILAVTFGNDRQPLVDGLFSTNTYTRILDDTGHGTHTAGVVAREDAHAIIVMVQVSGACRPGEGCVVDPSVAAAMEWAASQPWIDVVSVSLAIPTNPPTRSEAGPEEKAYLAASRAATESGKIIVNSAGNEPAPTVASYFSGPPWVVAVGGFEPKQQGATVRASKGADVVANFTEYMPGYQSVEAYDWSQGTSFSAPNVAGVLSRALYNIRAQVGAAQDGNAGFPIWGKLPDGMSVEVTAKVFRDALNTSARLVEPTGWDPTAPVTNDSSASPTGLTAPALFQPAQIGWGYVDGSIVAQIVERSLSPALLPAEKALTATYQTQYQAMREQYWSDSPS